MSTEYRDTDRIRLDDGGRGGKCEPESVPFGSQPGVEIIFVYTPPDGGGPRTITLSGQSLGVGPDAPPEAGPRTWRDEPPML